MGGVLFKVCSTPLPPPPAHCVPVRGIGGVGWRLEVGPSRILSKAPES